MTAPRDCRTMEEIRREIDRLDRDLVALLAARAAYVTRAGEIKQSADTVRDPARVEDVLAKVLAAAEAEGVPLEVAEATWRAMVEAFIRYEAKVFAERNG